MAAKKPSSAKPPVIDLEANKPAKAKEQPKSKEKQTASSKFSTGFNKQVLTSTFIAVIGGAVLGLGAAFMLAFLGFWPQQSTPANLLNSPADIVALEKTAKSQQQVISENANSLNSAVSRLEILEKVQKSNSQDNQVFQENLAQLTKQIAALRNQALTKNDLPEPVDLSQIEKRLTLLNDKITTIDAGANSADASAIVNSITLLREQSNILNNEITNLKASNANYSSKISKLNDSIAAVSQANDDLTQQLATLSTSSPNLIAPKQSPLSTTAFEGAINSGSSFIGELAAIKIAYPEIDIPKPIIENANTGFTSPNEIIKQFGQLVPELLAAKPIDENATWSQKLAQKTFSVLAIRPLGETEGDSIEAIIANIEVALNNNDFIKANGFFNMLPQELRLIASNSEKDIANMALAQSLINELKN